MIGIRKKKKNYFYYTNSVVILYELAFYFLHKYVLFYHRWRHFNNIIQFKKKKK